MIRLDVILAIARAEGRLTRRLVRYWVFVVLACYGFYSSLGGRPLFQDAFMENSE